MNWNGSRSGSEAETPLLHSPLGGMGPTPAKRGGRRRGFESRWGRQSVETLLASGFRYSGILPAALPRPAAGPRAPGFLKFVAHALHANP